VTGCSALLYIIGGMIQMGLEGEIDRALGARRMSLGISSLKEHTIICGFGRMGQTLAAELKASNSPFVIVEKSDERKDLAEEMGYLVMHSNATNEAALEDAQIAKARALATVLPVDADNVFITLSARNLNPNLKIFARGEIPSTEPKLRQAGADHVVLPATIGGVRLAHMIARPAATHLLSSLENAETLAQDLEELGINMGEIPIQPGSQFDGKTIADLEIKGTGAYLIVAIRRADGTLVTSPHGEIVVEGGDTMIVMGHGSNVPRLTLEPTPAREIYAPSGTKE
jgi:voltage-gated potassium channel